MEDRTRWHEGHAVETIPFLPTPPVPPGTDPQIAIDLLNSKLNLESIEQVGFVLLPQLLARQNDLAVLGITPAAYVQGTAGPSMPPPFVVKELTFAIHGADKKLLFATHPACLGCGKPLSGFTTTAAANGYAFGLDKAAREQASKHFSAATPSGSASRLHRRWSAS